MVVVIAVVTTKIVILEEVEEVVVVVVVAALFALLICLSMVLSLRCSSLLLLSLSFYHYHFHWYHQITIVTVYIQIGSYVPNYILYIYMNITHVCMKICVPSELFAAITRFNSNLFQKCLLPR